MENDKIPPNLSDLSDVMLNRIITKAQEERLRRVKSFIFALHDCDLEKLKETVKKGINWSEPILWESFINENARTTKEVVDFLLNLADSDLGQTIVTYRLGNDYKTPSRLIKNELKELLSQSSDIDLKLKDVLYHATREIVKNQLLLKDYKDDIVVLHEKIKPWSNYESILILSNFRNVDIDISNHKNLLSILAKSYDNFVKLIQYTSQNNLKLLSDLYPDMFRKAMNANNCEIVLEYIKRGSLEEFKFFKSLGAEINYEKSKGFISSFFQNEKPEILEAQKYVISDIEDISFGKQVILRSILNRASAHKVELVNLIMDRYENELSHTHDLIEMLNSAMMKKADVKRERNSCLDAVEKKLNYFILNNSLNNSGSSVSYRKMKV